jgi:hypothetical protein
MSAIAGGGAVNLGELVDRILDSFLTRTAGISPQVVFYM